VNVAVLASPADEQRLVSMLEVLAASGIEAFGLKIGPGWDDLDQERLLERLAKASHFLVVAAPESWASSWFAFSAGYCLGRGAAFVLYRLDPDRAFPRYLEGQPVIDTPDELSAYFAVERAEWLLRERRRAARESLLEMGVSFHGDALAQCVSEGDTRAVELFIRAGTQPNVCDKHGVPLLCLAARAKHRVVAELLLDEGAQIDAQSQDRGYSALMDAARMGAADLVDFFLSRGADPNLQSKDGQTALVIAVGRNDVETARKLLDYGADPGTVDKLGLSARKYAALFKNPAMLALLGPG